MNLDDLDLPPAIVGEKVCPQCGQALKLITDGLVGKQIAKAFHFVGDLIPFILVELSFWACSTCEFCEEVPE